MNLKSLLFYFVYLIPSSIIVLCIWYFLVDGSLYYCSDKAPFIDFIPPFIHKGYGDYFIAPQLLVYSIWISLIMIGLGIPLFLTKKTLRELISQSSSKAHKPEKRGK